MDTDLNNVKSRFWANPLDEPLGNGESHGCDESPEAIGGCYGISWNEYFRDIQTGEVYEVNCSDGVNYCKGAYAEEAEKWRRECQTAVTLMTQNAVKAGAHEIRISTNEWNIMKGCIHVFWLQSSEGKMDGKQADYSIKEGLIGYCWGVPVIVDPNKEDQCLLPRLTHKTTTEVVNGVKFIMGNGVPA
ncbi:MAG: hypothetical protein WC460_05200 [Patescibacteria group bacterium]